MCNCINTFLQVLQDKAYATKLFFPRVPYNLSMALLAHTYQRCYVQAEHCGKNGLNKSLKVNI